MKTFLKFSLLHTAVVAALWVALLPAMAATVTFTFANKTKSFTITAPNATRFANWAALAYPTIPNPAFDLACNPTPGPCAPATIPNPEPVLSAIDGLWAGITANVKNMEKSTSIKAIPEPADIN